MLNQPLALRALREVDFDWTMHMQSVWRDTIRDVETLHQPYRRRILDELTRLQHTQETNSPLGLVLVGSAGSGKTHLLSTLRRYALSHDLSFVLVDMTDVHNFWTTALQGYVDSLQQPEADGIPQFHKLLDFLIKDTKVPFSREQLAKAERQHVSWYIKEMMSVLNRRYPRAVIKHQDVIRALVLLNSDDFGIANVGYSWLLDLGVEEQDGTDFRFILNRLSDASKIVEGISWLLSLRSPTLLALDQMDSIVSQHHLAAGTKSEDELTDEQRVSRSIIESICGGLLALRDKTSRTLSLVSCLETTWRILTHNITRPMRDRFHDQLVLGPILAHQAATQIVTDRLSEAYNRVGFVPPYATWPFADTFFEEAKGAFPRRVLQRCHKHREKCLANQKISLLNTMGDAPNGGGMAIETEFPELEHALTTAKKQVQIMALIDEQHEDDLLGQLLQFAGECLMIENPTRDDIDALLDTNFAGGKDRPPLHARLRFSYRAEGDREQHLSLRALQRTHATAYQSRLKAAMTASGINRSLSFRRLLIVRTNAVPNGTKTYKLTQDFLAAGGLVISPTEDELRTLSGLWHVHHQNYADFKNWLQQRRLVSQLPFLQEAVTWLVKDTQGLVSHKGKADPPGVDKSDVTGDSSVIVKPPPPPSNQLPIGQRLIGGQIQEDISLPADELVKHTVILAGSGSGKTVLVKRIVEEAALLGIPSIVIDGANDLTRLGDPWPTPPDFWRPEDGEKARAYHQHSQVVIWTPGKETGNPVNLEPLPDLAAVANDKNELNEAVEMASDALQDLVATGNSHTTKLKRAILRPALLLFARQGGSQLADFVRLLSDLPVAASGGITDAPKLALHMADSLRAAILSNPLLRQPGAALDPALLFGVGQAGGRTRISVINLSGLVGLPAQQQFLNQLAMTLFTWIKKNPAPPDRPIRGLLVLDEAKDFVPSLGSTSCKANLLRLAAQARKYGLGLIFATQAPKSIDHNVIANCTIQFFGRTNSPNAIAVVQSQLQLRGGMGKDIAQLERGQFYAASESLNPPVKVQVPLCLSHHAATPLDEGQVLARAVATR